MSAFKTITALLLTVSGFALTLGGIAFHREDRGIYIAIPTVAIFVYWFLSSQENFFFRRGPVKFFVMWILGTFLLAVYFGVRSTEGFVDLLGEQFVFAACLFGGLSGLAMFIELAKSNKSKTPTQSQEELKPGPAASDLTRARNLYCVNCGTQHKSENQNFCANCGAKIMVT